MSKLMKYVTALGLIISAASQASDFNVPTMNKIYIDETEVDFNRNVFYVHTGHNSWYETHSVHRDQTGLFTFECSITLSHFEVGEYQKTWKCPYCYHHWPIGKPCGNKDCPSKYK